jgi:hypothetical protein
MTNPKVSCEGILSLYWDVSGVGYHSLPWMAGFGWT